MTVAESAAIGSDLARSWTNRSLTWMAKSTPMPIAIPVMIAVSLLYGISNRYTVPRIHESTASTGTIVTVPSEELP